MKVKLEEIIEALDFQPDETFTYLNKNTGEIITLFEEELRAAEEGESADDFPDWQKEQIETAAEVLESNNYIALPDKFDIHEWNIMRRFCLSLDGEDIRSDMLNSIHGAGAFRYFKDKLGQYNLADEWHGFRYEALREIAAEWCRENGLEYV